jgi:hypothetical protein
VKLCEFRYAECFILRVGMLCVIMECYEPLKVNAVSAGKLNMNLPGACIIKLFAAVINSVVK